MAFVRIRGLAKLIKAMKAMCAIIGLFGPNIRNYVPSGSRAVYDEALAAILAACAVLENIDYQDEDAATTTPWGS